MESPAGQFDLFTTDSSDGDMGNDMGNDNGSLESHEYEPLDYQLAELMQEFNGEQEDKKAQNKTLKACTLEISKHTREGQIAIVDNR